MKIKILDHVHCQVDKDKRHLLDPVLRHKYRIWIKTQYGQRPKDVERVFINAYTGTFPTGFLSMVKKHLKKKKIKFKVKGKLEKLKQERNPKLQGIVLRQDQEDAILVAAKKQRGIIQFPTATGKTVIAGGIISCFNLPRVLFVCRQVSLLLQTKKKFESYGFKNISIIDANHKEFNQITIATAQSLVNINVSEYITSTDIIIIDEAHEVAGSKQYEKILENCLAPVRIGLTATPQKEKIKKLYMYAFIGPIIARLSMKEAIDKKLIAKPVVKLEVVKFDRDIHDKSRTYQLALKYGIVNNEERNRLVLRVAQVSVAFGNSVLILVRLREHGRNLFLLANSIGFRVRYVWGETDGETRELAANLLNQKQYHCVIASSIWKQGIDIPSLNHVINAFGGKGDIPTIQVPGRGTRTDEGKKEEVLLTDFLDPYRYLAEHTVRRIQIYREQKWM